MFSKSTTYIVKLFDIGIPLIIKTSITDMYKANSQ
jgi:hypothetical protein